MNRRHDWPLLAHSAAEIAAKVLPRDRRVLIFGRSGSGKSTLAAELARTLWRERRRAWCLGADPGSPAFGIPGAVSLGEWQEGEWRLVDFEAVCSLDVARFRLPVIAAVGRLLERRIPALLFVDAPGVVHRVAGAELLASLIETARVEAVLALAHRGHAPPLSGELRAAGCEVFAVETAAEAHRPGKRQRAVRRTRLWEAHLENALRRQIPFRDVELTGTPPPVGAATAWTGRQFAVLDDRRTVALGEVIRNDGDALHVRMPEGRIEGGVLLVRDAARDESGFLSTTKRFAAAAVQYLPPPDVRPHAGSRSPAGPSPVARLGAATAVLVNGVFGDPLLHVRLPHQKRSLLFDLGEGGRLPARVSHQVTDVFISHAHVDHIVGFLWLLRSRLGDFPACRLFGPPGLCRNIENLMDGIHWDRVGESGARFEVAELHGELLVRRAVQAGGRGATPLGQTPVSGGVLLDESAFRVRAITLDHGTPVLAFAFEQPRQLNIRKDRLSACRLRPGSWLGELKRRAAEDDDEAPIRLPGGRVKQAGALVDDLVRITPGKKLVYATDLADTAENRKRLIALASDAHTFFCEASFVRADAEQAVRTGHLTARACGEIATAARVKYLIPFHFSKRYEKESERVYEEVRRACSQVVMPGREDGGDAD